MPWLDHFGLLAPYYDRVIRAQETARLAELIGLPIQGRLLDVGGGTGRIARLLIGQADQIVIADESWRMLAHVPPGISLPLAATRAERLPFRNGEFARVIMIDAFHHVQDQERTLAELLRVCAPGGHVVIEEPDISHVGVKVIALGERLLLMRSRFQRAEEIAARLRTLGASTSIYRESPTVWIVAEPGKASTPGSGTLQGEGRS